LPDSADVTGAGRAACGRATPLPQAAGTGLEMVVFHRKKKEIIEIDFI